MPCYETRGLSRYAVERLVALLVQQIGSVPIVEGRLIEAITRGKHDPIGYVRKVLENLGTSRYAAAETSKHLAINGKPDPNEEADRLIRETLRQMRPSNDSAGSDPRLLS